MHIPLLTDVVILLGVSLVVRDATRLNVSPVYFKAWLKGGGRIEVVRPFSHS